MIPTPPPPPEPEAAPSTAAGEPDLRVVFKATETAVPLSVKEPLSKLGEQLKASEGSRVNLFAYASAAADQATTARRVSLARALAVRAYLIDQGIGSMRINVHAEGDKNPGGDANRVDLFVVKEKQ